MNYQTLNMAFKLAFVGLFLLLLFMMNGMKKEAKTLREDLAGLNVAISNKMDTTRNALGQMRAEVKTIALSEGAAKVLISDELSKIRKDFGFRVSGLKTYIEAGSEHRIPVIIEGKDTIIERTTEKVFYMNERGYSGTLYTRGDSLIGSISISDTIRIIVSKGKRDKWWQIWRKRPLVTNAFLSNKDGSVTTLKSVISE